MEKWRTTQEQADGGRKGRYHAVLPVVILPETGYVQEHGDHRVPLIRVDEILEGRAPASTNKAQEWEVKVCMQRMKRVRSKDVCVWRKTKEEGNQGRKGTVV